MGLLAQEELSGYDLKRRMEMPVGFFWQAGHSQIYPELARLEERELVTHRVVEQPDRPDKKVYKITRAGLGLLKGWVTAPVKHQVIRDELVLKAYFLWLADPGESLVLFHEQEKVHREQLARYEEIQAWMEREWAGDLKYLDLPRFSSYAALMRGISFEREYADWCRWVAEHLERGAEGK